MKTEDLIDKIEILKPNSYDSDFIKNLIEKCDKKIYSDFLSQHPSVLEEYKQKNLAEDAELLLPDEYEDVYLSYVMAKMDYYQGDYERYNNEMTMYNSKWLEFVSWFTRNYSCEDVKITIS